MATIINNPPAQKESGGMVGMIIGILALVVVGYLFITYGVPAVRQMQSGSTQINVPSEIDVNINQAK